MIHGGDRYRNQIDMDYSINVNPLDLPAAVRGALQGAIDQVEFYPDLQAEQLTLGIAEHYQLDADWVACGNGASELLMAFGRAFALETVLLPVPSFAGYPYALEAAGISIRYLPLDPRDLQIPGEALLKAAEELPTGAEGEPRSAILLTNPNNPTGSYVPEDLMRALLTLCREKGILLVVDECFMELSDAPKEHSLTGLLREAGDSCLILRAFTKSFAIPGVRLGYMLGSPKRISAIKRQLPEWNLSAFAQAAGIAALGEKAYLRSARALIRQQRELLQEALKTMGFETYPSVTNFILFRKAEGTEEVSLYQKLLNRGTLIRDCSNYKGLHRGYYRIAVRTERENEILLQQLRQIVEEEDRKR